MRRLLGKLAAALLAGAFLAGLPAGAEPHKKHAPIVIPFELSGGGHIVMQVKLNGIAGRAVLDNGAFTSVVDKKWGEDHGLAKGSQGARNFIRAFTIGYDIAKSATFTLAGQEEEVTPILVDLSAVQDDPAKPIIAIVGEEMFHRHIVTVDYTHHTVTMTDPSDFTPPADVQPTPVVSVLGTAKLQVPIALDGDKPLLAIIDLGNPVTLIVRDNKQTQGWSKDGRKQAPMEASVLRGDNMVGSKGRMTSAKTISFGGHEFKDVPLVVGGFDMMLVMNALVGEEILSRFDITFDVPHARIWLRPRADVDKPFHKLLVGVAWKPPVTPGALKADNVMPGSPAEKAGLKEGDVVARINGKTALPSMLSNLKAGDQVLLELVGGKQLSLVADTFY